MIVVTFQKNSYLYQSFQFSESTGLAYSAEDDFYRCLTSIREPN